MAKWNGSFLRWGMRQILFLLMMELLHKAEKEQTCIATWALDVSLWYCLRLESLNIGLWTEILCQYAAGCQIQWMRLWYVVVVCFRSSEVWRIQLTCVINYWRLVKVFDARDVHITIWSSATWFTYLVFLMRSVLLCIL
jgi:hypothetical protein